MPNFINVAGEGPMISCRTPNKERPTANRPCRRSYARPGIFITGTDTGVGKTVVSAALILAIKKQGIDCGYFKPVASGAEKNKTGWMSPDLRLILNTTGLMDPPPLMNPVCLVPPLAPLPAAECSGVEWSRSLINKALKLLQSYHDFLVVEGVGGLMVPLKKKFWVIDLIKQIGFPVLVIGRPGLGTINHTLMTLTLLKLQKVKVLGFLFNGQKGKPGLVDKTAPKIIQDYSKIPYWGTLPWDNEVSEEEFRLGSIPRRLETMVIHFVKTLNADSPLSFSKASSSERKHSRFL
jgi:dethiobiotin synthetase